MDFITVITLSVTEASSRYAAGGKAVDNNRELVINFFDKKTL